MSAAMMPVKKEVMSPTSPAMPDETETRDDAADSGTLAAEAGSSAKVVPSEAGDMNVLVVTTPENGSGQPRIDKKRKKIRKKKKKTVATPDEPLAERPASSSSRPSLKRSAAFLDEESSWELI